MAEGTGGMRALPLAGRSCMWAHTCVSMCMCVSMWPLWRCVRVCTPTVVRHLTEPEDNACSAACCMGQSQPDEGRAAHPPGEPSEDRFPSVWADFSSHLISPAMMQRVDTDSWSTAFLPSERVPAAERAGGPASSGPTRSPVPLPGAGPAIDGHAPVIPNAHSSLVQQASMRKPQCVRSLHQIDFVTIGLTTLLRYHLHTIKFICISDSTIFSAFTELGSHHHSTVRF